jgi:hypothetical protein
VGTQGLADDYNHIDGGGTAGWLLVYQACRAVEVCGVVYWGYEQLVLSLGYCKSPSTSPLFVSEANEGQCDDLILRKVNESDASVFAQRYGGSSQCWGVIWSIVSLVFMIGGIIAGLAAFPESASQQEDDSKKFIPTR